MVAPILDVFRPSKKEEQVSNVRVYGNIAGEVPGNYVINPRDRVSTTIKETTLHAPNTYIGNQKEGGYLALKSNQSPIREIPVIRMRFVALVAGRQSMERCVMKLCVLNAIMS